MERRDILKSAGVVALAAMAGAASADHDEHAHCLVLLGKGDKEMAACAQSVNQLLAVCAALQKLAGQDSRYTPGFARLAAEVCADCEKECRKHENKHAECKACADSCAACVLECRTLAA